MNHSTTGLIKNRLNNEYYLLKFESVLPEVLLLQLEENVNELLSNELEQFLVYERYKQTNEMNSRNGLVLERKKDTKCDPTTIKKPRTYFVLFVSSLILFCMRYTQETES